MSMHLEGPWLSTTGKKKGKKKFVNSAQKNKAAELDRQWQEMQKSWDKLTPKFARTAIPPKPVVAKTPIESPKADEPKSLNEWITGAVASKPTMQYTGDKIKGIGTMHKSNAVPIFTDDEAKDISKMRR